MVQDILFIQGAGEGAYEGDRLLVGSLSDHLGQTYNVHYPPMPNEESPTYAIWKAEIIDALSGLGEKVILVGHSLGGINSCQGSFGRSTPADYCWALSPRYTLLGCR